MSIAQIPTPLAVYHRRIRRELEWTDAIDETLIRRAGWLWRDYDDPDPAAHDIPGDVGDAWCRYVFRYRRHAEIGAPHDVDWGALWRAFVEIDLARRAEWRDAVERAVWGWSCIVRGAEP